MTPFDFPICFTSYRLTNVPGQVDFNAGVVAAGEAQIESTVLGNISPFETTDKQVALMDQSQVYLPINNAISKIG